MEKKRGLKIICISGGIIILIILAFIIYALNSKTITIYIGSEKYKVHDYTEDGIITLKDFFSEYSQKEKWNMINGEIYTYNDKKIDTNGKSIEKDPISNGEKFELVDSTSRANNVTSYDVEVYIDDTKIISKTNSDESVVIFYFNTEGEITEFEQYSNMETTEKAELMADEVNKNDIEKLILARNEKKILICRYDMSEERKNINDIILDMLNEIIGESRGLSIYVNQSSKNTNDKQLLKYLGKMFKKTADDNKMHEMNNKGTIVEDIKLNENNMATFYIEKDYEKYQIEVTSSSKEYNKNEYKGYKIVNTKTDFFIMPNS